METIYCQNCKELSEKRKHPYCLKYKENLRSVPMDDAVIKPIKCLKCIEENKK